MQTGRYALGAEFATVSENGWWVAFVTNADNPLLNDSDGYPDIYAHNLTTSEVKLITQDHQTLNSPGYTGSPILSSDGGYIVFESDNSKLIAGDTNETRDIFLVHLVGVGITRISVATGNVQANDKSYSPVISYNGRYTAFSSRATNLAAGDTNGLPDIFVHDRQTGQTTRISIPNGGGQALGPAPDGVDDLYTYPTSISPDGQYIVFSSKADNLVADDTNGLPDIFVRDVVAGTTKRISVDSNGVQANGISYGGIITDNGQTVVFASDATNLVVNDTNNAQDIFRYDLLTNQVTRVSLDESGGQIDEGVQFGSFSRNGRYIVFESTAQELVAGDTNGVKDVFRKDLQTGQITLISTNTSGVQSSQESFASLGAISSDGNFVVFVSGEANWGFSTDNNGIPDAFLRNINANTTQLVSLMQEEIQGNNLTYRGAISDDGRYVAFVSSATNLYPYDTTTSPDLYLYDREIGEFTHISPIIIYNYLGQQYYYSISGDGRYIAFIRNFAGISIYDRQTDTIEDLPFQNASIGHHSLSYDGRYLVFSSSYIPTPDSAQEQSLLADVFRYDRQTGEVLWVSRDFPYNRYDTMAYYPSISDDGQVVVFLATPGWVLPNLTGILVIRDIALGMSSQLSPTTYRPMISGNGRFVAYNVNNQLSIYDRRLRSSETVKYTDTYGVTEPVPASGVISISNDGSLVGFSWSDNFYQDDVMLYDVISKKLLTISENVNASSFNIIPTASGISGDGYSMWFASTEGYIVPGDTNGQYDIFLVQLAHDAPPQLVAPNDGWSAIEADESIAVQFSWSETPNATRYQIQIATDPQFNNLVAESFISRSFPHIPPATTSTQNLAPLGTYYWRVRSNPIWSDVRQFTITPTAPPQLMTPADGFSLVTPDATTNITFSWTVVADANRYYIQVATDPQFNNLIVDSVIQPASTTFNHAFTPLGSYYWRVRSNANWSDVNEFTLTPQYYQTNITINEQDLFALIQPYLSPDIPVVILDITANGIIATAQLSDGTVITGIIKMEFANQLITIWVEDVVGGSLAQSETFSTYLIETFMGIFEDITSDEFVEINQIIIVDDTLLFTLIFSN